MEGFDDSKEHWDQDPSRNERDSDQMFGNEQPAK